MVDIVVSYFELKNDNFNVVIDDTYNSAKFLGKYDVTLNTFIDRNNSSYYVEGSDYTWSGTVTAATGNTLRELGFDYDEPSDADYEKFLASLNSQILSFARTLSGRPIRSNSILTKINGIWNFNFNLFGYQQGDVGTVVSYTIAKMMPSKFGLQVFNAEGTLVFDALKGYLQLAGIMTGGVNTYTNPAATYTITLSEELSSEHLFISDTMSYPWRNGMRITSSGVQYGEANFYPVMSFPNLTTIEVKLMQNGNIPGTTGSRSFNYFYEAVIYCPYPKNFYTGKQ
ncbi:hypothetical protein QMJ91_17015 [Acinetobacter baumannii]|uniref:hypothetical protein n=1 Tax=Acinetobacter TaxID=469 RepID=UPI000A6DA92A|nr:MULTISPECIES: hypothetical protein [Acinetobacter]MBS4736542.1 hypothetical protein [Acinetobacter baumannii]MCE6129807.1 hypothetical protein [Acinetobacter baumannii]MCH1775288.1 hypothetical protein [Acinetobacter baumannii]MCR0002887.1 hypothetical protein [Acinetobacter baumannii]MCZ3132765.1 hypothetical protein [Acinetobacter baumannii]